MRVDITCLDKFSMTRARILTKGVRYGRQGSEPLKYTIFLLELNPTPFFRTLKIVEK